MEPVTALTKASEEPKVKTNSKETKEYFQPKIESWSENIALTDERMPQLSDIFFEQGRQAGGDDEIIVLGSTNISGFMNYRGMHLESCFHPEVYGLNGKPVATD